ncbi:alkyl sulfatase dimerization domain-containing protein [Streptomyces anulatus]|uniref:alkyl sulfatase dimerization domain-containing protein n=1 Tax=Streptomyces anulatus TaxID=1892 RepID=UPI00371B733B
MFADPDDTEAKNLQADAYEQLGYQAEVPQYRAIFLTAAQATTASVPGPASTPTASTPSSPCPSICSSISPGFMWTPPRQPT